MSLGVILDGPRELGTGQANANETGPAVGTPDSDPRIPLVVGALRAGVGKPGRWESDARRVLAALDQQADGEDA